MAGKKWKAVAVLPGMVLLLAVLGCGGEQKTPVKKEEAKQISGDVLIYTSMNPDNIETISKPRIAERFSGLNVRWFAAPEEKIKGQLGDEIQSKRINADIVMAADPSYYVKLKKDNLLLDYVSPEYKKILTDKDEKGAWASVRVSTMIIAYNKDKLKEAEAPQSWLDLTGKKWKGKIAMPDPMTSGTALVAAGALADKYGWEFFDKLKDNEIRVEDISVIPDKLLKGDYVAAILLEEQVLSRVAEKKAPLKAVYPSDGIICIPSPIAIFKSTKNPEGAKSLVDWWLSRDGQETVLKEWMHSVRDDMRAPAGAPELKTLLPNALKMDWVKLAEQEGLIKEAFRSHVIEGRKKVPFIPKQEKT